MSSTKSECFQRTLAEALRSAEFTVPLEEQALITAMDDRLTQLLKETVRRALGKLYEQVVVLIGSAGSTARGTHAGDPRRGRPFDFDVNVLIQPEFSDIQDLMCIVDEVKDRLESDAIYAQFLTYFYGISSVAETRKAATGS